MGITGTQNIHFPDTTDFVEDTSLWVETLARQADTRLTSHDLDAARYGDGGGLPMCVMSMTAGTTIVANVAGASNLTQWVRMDTVNIDTDGMADLDANPWAITVNTVGYYRVGFYCRILSTGCNAGTGYALFSAGRTTGTKAIRQMTADGSNANPVGGGASTLAQVSAPGAFFGGITCSPNGTNCSNLLTVQYARIWAYKVRDYP